MWPMRVLKKIGMTKEGSIRSKKETIKIKIATVFGKITCNVTYDKRLWTNRNFRSCIYYEKSPKSLSFFFF